MIIKMNYDNYSKCNRCNTMIKDGVEHSVKECNHNYTERYINNRIKLGVIKGMFYSISILFFLVTGSYIALQSQLIKRIIEINTILIEHKEVTDKALLALADAIELIK